MLDSGESQKEVIRPDFNRSIMIDFHGATITSDVGFLLMREIDDRIKEGRNTLRWDKTSCQRFEANQARRQMGAYNLLHVIRQFYAWGEEVKRSIDWLIKRLIKVGARVSLPCPAVVCAYRLGLSSVSSLPGGAGLGHIGFPASWPLVIEGLVCPKSGGN